MKKIFSNTNWNLYRSFIILYETGKYTAAERILHLDRKCIRQNIVTLQNQIDETLFISHTKGVTPTNAAHTLYPMIKKSIDGIVEAERVIKNFDKTTEAVVRLGIPGTIVGIILVDFFKNFRIEYPNIKLEFYERTHRDTPALLLQRKLDFVIDLKYNCEKYNFKTIDIFEFNYCFIASKKYLKEKGLGTEMTIEQIKELQIIGQRYAVQQLMNEHGVDLQPAILTALTETVLPYVESGTGIGYFPDGLIEMLSNEELIKISVTNFNPPGLIISLGYNQGYLTQPTQILIDSILMHFKKVPFGNSFL